MVTDKEMLDQLLDQYYEAHGWDVGTGIPTREALETLGLLELCGDCAAA
jgi:aldehyde:ferredoxin oxidoreductase